MKCFFNAKTAGFVLSIEALLAVAAFSMTSALVLNLLYKGSENAGVALQRLENVQLVSKMLYREFCSPQNSVAELSAATVENVILVTAEIAETAKFAASKKYLRYLIAYPGKMKLTTEESGSQFMLDKKAANQLLVYLPNGKDDDKEPAT